MKLIMTLRKRKIVMTYLNHCWTKERETADKIVSIHQDEINFVTAGREICFVA